MAASLRFGTQLVLCAMFFLSSVGKFRSGRFVADVADYRLLPVAAVIPVARALPYAELSLAVLLLAPPLGSIPLYVAAGLLLLFAAAMAMNLSRGRVVSCGCRGTSQPISWALVAKNTCFAVAAMLVGAATPSTKSVSLSNATAIALAATMVGLGWRLVSQLRDANSRLSGLAIEPAPARRTP